ncbi:MULTISPECIES: flagellar basal body-associated protein FliL [Modicisalibacter]|uniref:Flagellar protein FliL n=1 Tax=Modicisalibacter tunisiensis TaxID=390637 RepID=A0ABS7X072_9GAMM|nr:MULTISPECIES: flagellar basal body-associated protein FliL [Modicisalibacter]MBZ9538310.1 flagellar basal body-associated protein FliL [Modicisalibacter tunisiensis]MBZ9568278.1 flagellar basal body-associated protein FliL [Modicisalibacter tunisiensis]
MAKTKTDGKSRKPWWLLGLLIILISGACSAGVYFLLESRISSASQTGTEEAAPQEPATPIFVTIDPFTVNIQSDDYSQRLLYIGLSLKVLDDQTREALLTYMPQVRSRLLMLLSGQKAGDLVTPAGKQSLSQAILALFDKPFANAQKPLQVEDVLYTDFIVQ